MLCPSCRRSNVAQAKFCTSCGATLEKPATLPAVQYPSFPRRTGALFLDWLLIFVIYGLIALALFMRTGWKWGRAEPLLEWVYLMFLGGGWLYWAGLESSGLQATLGKRAFGMMVTDLNGHRITFARASGRYFAKFLSGVFFYVGFIMAAFTPKRQGLHDLIAGTLVVARTEPMLANWQDPTKPFYS